MDLNDWLGTLGVLILLVAFMLNLMGRMDHHSHAYQGLNAVGAAVLGIVAWRIQFMPFVVLEVIWVAVSLGVMLRIIPIRN